MKGRFGDKQRILHVLEAIDEIEQYVRLVTFETFLGNSMMRFACIKQLEIIGEACNHVEQETRAKYPDVEWRKIIGLRHLLIHEYFGVDIALVWDIIQHDLPDLKVRLTRLLEDF
ncbi:DUF86 domain-containing protein [Rudanella paleaurantiibacter]|uniref:DUF86 domain-containing protein n=1 Tax=Rudanella paleaurantiibacter TaxID=2614655 RepID=A0A7J5U273_9BACT|nr:DUF86 domain-containing protein [Rudanella paleaurantiibacter]KAB7731899.1 DUF86 domain-containing protein [Rudanella paleaurantiibacter]